MHARDAAFWVFSVSLLISVWAQPGLNGDAPPALAPDSPATLPPGHGRPEDVRAIGALLQGVGRGKFREPVVGLEDVVQDEFLATFAANTPRSTVNAIARQLKAASADLEFKYIGNTRRGWKGLAFKVPAQPPEATAALLDSLLAVPELAVVEANGFVTAYRPLATSSGALPGRALQGRGNNKPKPSPSPSPSTSPPLEDPTTPPPPPAIIYDCTTVSDIYTTPRVASAPSWGLDRIDSQALPLDNVYSYSSADASAVWVYVVDTGILPNHPELAGRVTLGFDAFNSNGVDANGHGTHCAGTVGGTNVGVAKGVNLVSVRVLDSRGSGTWSGVIAGIDYVANNIAKPNRIISMSLGGGANVGVNDAVARATAAGVLAVVAAGNSGADACNYSPASAPSAITVGATDQSDFRASFSNYGSCVDIWAPGVYIYSSYLNNGYAYMSGTSMATPHVAGAAARLWSKGACSNVTTCATMLTDCQATPGMVQGGIGAAPNKLLHVNPGI